MSTTMVFNVGCPNCGTRQDVPLAESANVQRAATWKRAVLDGTFHRFNCNMCDLPFRVERDTLFSDLEHGVLIAAFAPTRRDERVALEMMIAETWAQTIELEAPHAVRVGFTGPGPRVVFGLAALREKVLCFDRRLDDRLVEAVKLALLEGIAGRAEAGVADLFLVDVAANRESLQFQPVDAHGNMVGGHWLHAPFAMYDDFEKTRETLSSLLPDLFRGLWVHWSLARPAGLRTTAWPETTAEAGA